MPGVSHGAVARELLKRLMIEPFIVRRRAPLPQSSRSRGRFITPPLKGDEPLAPAEGTMPAMTAAFTVVLTEGRPLRLPLALPSTQLPESKVRASATRDAGRALAVLVVPSAALSGQLK